MSATPTVELTSRSQPIPRFDDSKAAKARAHSTIAAALLIGALSLGSHVPSPAKRRSERRLDRDRCSSCGKKPWDCRCAKRGPDPIDDELFPQVSGELVLASDAGDNDDE